MKDYRYLLLALRLVICFLAAFNININGHWYLIPKALVSPLFYVAFTVSFGICYFLLYYIDRVNMRLDQTHPWKDSWRPRTIRQLVFGILIPALADLFAVALYFLIVGKANKFNEHLYYEYQKALLFIIIVNLFYVIISFAKDKKVSLHTSEDLVIKHNGEYLRLNAENDILFFIRDRKLIKVLTVAGKTYSFKSTISNLQQKYEGTCLCQINPSVIINTSTLQGYRAGTTRDTLIPVFKSSYDEHLKQTDLTKLRITKEYISNFREKINLD